MSICVRRAEGKASHTCRVVVGLAPRTDRRADVAEAGRAVVCAVQRGRQIRGRVGSLPTRARRSPPTQ
jgi:hypothetical protein